MVYTLAIVAALISLTPSLIFADADAGTTIHATPKGGSVWFNGGTIKTEELNTAIRKARGGDTVLVLPGTYSQALTIQKTASAEKPVIIRGIDGLTTFACNDLPAKEGKPSVRITMSKGVELRGFIFSQCWPSAIEITDSEFVTIAENEFKGSRYGIEIRERTTHHILVENNTWEQSSGTTNLNTKNAADFAGAFVGAFGMSGDLIVRNNSITNGHALLYLGKTKKQKIDYPVQNVFVHDNKVENIKGETIVLEQKAANLQTDGGSRTSEATPYPAPMRLISYKPEKNNVILTFSHSKPLKGLGKLAIGRLEQKSESKSSCEQKGSELRCSFSEPVPATADALWLEVGEEDPITSWGNGTDSTLTLIRAKEKRSGVFK